MRPALPVAALLIAALALPITTASARQAPPSQADLDRSGSPYFVVNGGKPGVDTMPLESTRADISVAGTIAHVKVTQVYKNSGDDVLEAIYVFPGSTRAAVFGMRMTVGDRTIVAQIQKKEDARQIYEDAKKAGQSASLLEQHRPNVFQMNVANILPGDRITVELDYTELLVPTDGTYELVYPAVVGPRYTGESSTNEGFTEQPFTREGVAPSYAWDVAVRVAAGLPLQRVASSSHAITVKPSADRSTATVAMNPGGPGGTKDFVLTYQLAGKAIASGALLYPPTDGEDGYFLAMVQPPATVARDAMPKREYVFVIDVSGSMRGFPLDVSKQVIDKLFTGLRPQDRFNILFFDAGNKLLSEESLPATKANIALARAMLASVQGGGGTRLLQALQRVFALPTPDDFARTFVVVTDGYISVEPQVFELIRDNLGKASLFSFGIGSSVNRHLIEGMSRVGQGEPFYVMHGDDAAEKAAAFNRYIEAPALTRVKVAFSGFDAYDVEPTAVPDLFASRPVVVFGKYRGAPRGTITVSGLTGEGPWSQTLDVAAVAPDAANVSLRYLWARHRIATLGDLNNLRTDDARVAEITDLGLKYGLLTAYTSFVAVDERVRNAGGESTTIKQPLPLPAGVTDTAVSGGFAGSGSASGRGYALAERRSRPAPRPTKASADVDAPVEESESRPDPRPRVAVRVISVSGKIGEAALGATLRRLQGRLASCAPGGSGRTFEVTLTIDARGRITGVKFSGTDSGGAAARRCLEAQLKRMTVPAPADPGETTAKIELVLG